MYVCVCNAVSDHQIRAEVARGATSVEALGERLLVATGCGRCHEEAQALIDTYGRPADRARELSAALPACALTLAPA